ncbi:HAD family hydrolase [Acidithiobacillus sp. AMEEHan]|uniref:HAD family hydrolase n=1 Tax=Acidithiobacillus sp. AMEEHan TaxID=2994951 RepID=UPI0027E50225|nr:HAD family hydrolase [Acidithiobacillus sp. AMEEHan]
MTHGDITKELANISAISLQPTAQQGMFKVSYYLALDLDYAALEEEILQRLWGLGVNAKLIWSVDELANIRLLDILPCSASKLHAIEFLVHQHGYSIDQTVFAGDSGNDLEVLGSHINSVLVANAHPDVREQALRLASASDLRDTLYLAKGGFLGMNGNYAAGILEGIAHYLPKTAAWMEPIA